MRLLISPKVRKKLLDKHQVTEAQVVQCFANRFGPTLLDTREQHQTTPPTRWFIAETDYGIKLKVVFVLLETGEVALKSAFPPNATENSIYSKQCG